MEAGALTGTHAAPGIPKRVTFVDKELPPPIPRGKPLRHQQAFPPCFPSICFFFFLVFFSVFFLILLLTHLYNYDLQFSPALLVSGPITSLTS